MIILNETISKVKTIRNHGLMKTALIYVLNNFRLKNLSNRDESDSVLKELKKTRRIYNKAIYCAQNKFVANVHNEVRSQPHAYWNVINSAIEMKDNNFPIDIELFKKMFVILAKL